MAVDLSSLTGPWAIKRVAMDATAGNVVAVTLPTWARRASASFKQTDDATADTGKIASSGTDGAAIGNDFMPVASGAERSWPVTGGKERNRAGVVIYVAGGTNSGYMHLEVSAYEGA